MRQFRYKMISHFRIYDKEIFFSTVLCLQLSQSQEKKVDLKGKTTHKVELKSEQFCYVYSNNDTIMFRCSTTIIWMFTAKCYYQNFFSLSSDLENSNRVSLILDELTSIHRGRFCWLLYDWKSMVKITSMDIVFDVMIIGR